MNNINTDVQDNMGSQINAEIDSNISSNRIHVIQNRILNEDEK